MPTLEWIGKDKVINHHLEVPYRILDKKYTYNAEKSENKIIHGDNLEALKSLLPEYEGKIKCIYIDPPYNTGNEKWVYNDNVNDPKIKKWLGEVVGQEGEDLSRHDKWLCMMYPRLKLLQKLLSDDGAIFISIDDNEQANLKLICDEIFGSSHHIATFVWQKRYSRENREAIGDAHEYILLYVKDNVMFKEQRHLVPMSEEQAKVYKNPNNDPKGRWRGVPMTAQGFRPNQMYPITDPKGNVHYPPEGRCWSTIESEFLKMRNEGRIYFGKNNDSQPNIIRYLSEVEGVVPWTWLPSDEVGHTDSAKKEVFAILGKTNSFDTPKPETLIRYLFSICTNPGDIILDSFAGSGTTAHAVLNMNKSDGGNRKFILIEMMDYADSITAERVKRVINGYGNGKNAVEGTGGDFSFYELGEVLLLPDGNLNEKVDTAKIREYIWYMETRAPFEETNNENPYYLGSCNNTGYYFFYEKESVTTLSHDFLSTIKEKSESYLIYADLCTIPEEELRRYNITFKKIPRDIVKL